MKYVCYALTTQDAEIDLRWIQMSLYGQQELSLQHGIWKKTTSNHSSSFIKYSVIIWETNYIYQGGWAVGNINYIYVMFDMFEHFTKWFPRVCLVLGFLLYIFMVESLFCHCTWIISAFVSYNGVCMDMFVNVITVSVLLCFCMLYNLIVSYTSFWCFVLYLSCV